MKNLLLCERIRFFQRVHRVPRRDDERRRRRREWIGNDVRQKCRSFPSPREYVITTSKHDSCATTTKQHSCATTTEQHSCATTTTTVFTTSTGFE